MKNSPQQIRLSIDRLVLDGINFNQQDARLFQRALEAELSHALREEWLGGWRPSPSAFASLDGAAIGGTSVDSPIQAGRAASESILSTLNPNRNERSRAAAATPD